MRVRCNSAFVASILFTVALLSLVPSFWSDVFSARDLSSPQSDDVWHLTALRYIGYFALASLVIILIGLTVTWLGFLRKARWTWFVQFIITWAYVFPLLVSPLLAHSRSRDFSQLLYSAIHQRGIPRISAESILIFLLMLAGLLIPLRSFFRDREVLQPTHSRSPLIAVICSTTAIVAVCAFFLWINFRPYELSPAELKAGRDIMFAVPPPPPPPDRVH